MRIPLKLILASAASLLISYTDADAAQTTIAFDSGSASLLYTTVAKNTPLTAGSPSANHDGAILQLGYYQGATSANPFPLNATFVALTGPMSLNTDFSGVNNTTVGDDFAQGASDGRFALTLAFVAGSTTSGNSFPNAGQILAMQFYSTTTISPTSFYNVASNAAWTWQTPQDGALAPSLAYSFGNAGTVWLGGASTAYYTSLPTPVPEPSACAVFALGAAGLMCRRAWLRHNGRLLLAA